MSEFEQGNEDAFRIVRNHRECYPAGERVVLASEQQCLDLLAAKKSADRDRDSCRRRAEEAEARLRTWHIIAMAAGAAGMAAGFLGGLLC